MSGGTDARTVLGDLAATGTINTAPGVPVALAISFTIGDGVGGTTTFEFDSNGTVAAGDVGITFGPADSADLIKTRSRNAVSSSALSMDGTDGGYAVVALVDHFVGSAGNVPITETVS